MADARALYELVAEDRTRSVFESLKSRLVESLSTFKGLAVGGTAAFAAISVAALKAGERLDATSKTARQLGITAREYEALGHAASLAGVRHEGFAISLQNIERRLYEIASGRGAEGAAALKRLGIEIDPKRPLELVEALEQIADGLQEIADPTARVGIALELFGRQGRGMLTFLEGGRAGMRDLKNEAVALGLVMSEDLYRAAESTNDQIARLKSQGQSLATLGLAPLIPILGDLAGLAITVGSRFATMLPEPGDIEGTKLAIKQVADEVERLGLSQDEAKRRLEELFGPDTIRAIERVAIAAGMPVPYTAAARQAAADRADDFQRMQRESDIAAGKINLLGADLEALAEIDLGRLGVSWGQLQAAILRSDVGYLNELVARWRALPIQAAEYIDQIRDLPSRHRAAFLELPDPFKRFAEEAEKQRKAGVWDITRLSPSEMRAYERHARTLGELSEAEKALFAIDLGIKFERDRLGVEALTSATTQSVDAMIQAFVGLGSAADVNFGRIALDAVRRLIAGLIEAEIRAAAAKRAVEGVGGAGGLLRTLFGLVSSGVAIGAGAGAGAVAGGVPGGPAGLVFLGPVPVGASGRLARSRALDPEIQRAQREARYYGGSYA